MFQVCPHPAAWNGVRPEEVVYSLEDGEGLIPGLEGFEAEEGVDPDPEVAVLRLQEVVAHRYQPSSVADWCAFELGDDLPGSVDDLSYRWWVG